MKNDLQDSLDQIIKELDLYALAQLITTLSPDQLNEDQTAITEAYLEIYYMLLYDLDCNRIREEDQEELIYELIGILDSVEKINPTIIYYEERAACYKLLANFQTDKNKKINALQKAIDEYRRAVQTSEYKELNASLAAVLLDKAAVSNEFDKSIFDEAYRLLNLAYTKYSEKVMCIFLYTCFDILEYEFDGKEQIHADFISKFNNATYIFTKKDLLIYLGWSNELSRILDNNRYPISLKYYSELNNFIISLLNNLTQYSTDSQDLLNKLGQEFERAAKRVHDNTFKKLELYNYSLNYFVKGQEINPLAWTFPVYATNVLKEIGCIYFEINQPEKLIEAFEKGRVVFANTLEPDFTLNLNWGRFLIEYASLAYNFEAPNLLWEAEEKLLVAKTLGENYYDQPFLLLAKVALKSGDIKKCIEILKECKTVFTNPYSIYSFSQVIEDKDFLEIMNDEIFKE